MEFKEVMHWLVLNGFVTIHKDKPIFTDKGRKELNSAAPPPPNTSIAPPPPSSLPSKVVTGSVDWETMYKQFIMQCKVPARGYDSYGRAYAMNKYSVDGMQAFKKAVLKGYKVEFMALAVAVYYRSPDQFKKSIGNYMATGEWETDYDVMVSKHEAGTLGQHIKKETDGNTGSRFTRD